MNDEEIFHEALARDPADRAAYLDRACAGDPAVRAAVEALLRANVGASGFLARPAVPMPGEDDTRTAPSVPDADGPLDFLDPSDKPGSVGRLGHYEVQQVVGRGGMGVVLKAFDENLHRVVAVKVMAPQLAASATARQRFTREARAAAAVTHDHVVTIHGVEESKGLPYIVMQYVAGHSLQDRLDRGGPLPVTEVLRIGVQAASGLAAAHKQGLVHRDVKPANILLENGVERVKLTDFGLARAADDASLTQSGVIAGTPQYMSPEQAEGKPVDARSDLFSLGSVLYAMCTGRPPFRGSTARAVLRRVCEDAPPPVREVSPEVPDWLCVIIAKLHAKDPADRYQSAAEVAEVLGRHLAHVQHPSVVPLPAAVKAADRPPAPVRRSHAGRRWAAAAAVLVAVLAVLGTTEATGVTKVRATVIRIFTSDGTLVVETDDPGVKVTVEGDGDLVITGAGPQEVRLRPGSYKLHAVKDGKPVRLDHDLVTITRGDTQVVRVRLEGGPAAPAAVVPKAEAGAFVVLGGKGVAERKFDRLADAVQGASDGDTIEVRGNGPFVTQPISIQHALTIRAGEGHWPVIRLTPDPVQNKGALIRTNAPLVLQGLALDRAIPDDDPRADPFVRSYQASLWAANCRFGSAIWADHPYVCEFRNCEFIGAQARLVVSPRSGTRVIFENCLHRTTGGAIHPFCRDAALHDVSFQIKRSTFVSWPASLWFVCDSPLPASSKAEGSRPIHLEVSESIFDVPAALGFEQSPTFLEKAAVLDPAEAEAALLGMLQWRGKRNLFADGSTSLWWTVKLKQQPPRGPKTLDEWKAFWGTAEANSLAGSIRFRGGNLRSWTGAALDRLTPEDFRLRPDSAGYRAGQDGKDLGADVDLVGPGAAYERWKKTPDYQQWLKDTKLVAKAETPKAESKAFVLLGGKGVEARKFDTLAEAVQGASGGDTIEVRGNGPFVSDELTISHPLVIRAGTGYTPSIALSRAAADREVAMLTVSAPLVVEGLELRRMGGPAGQKIIDAWNCPALHIANSRLVFTSSAPLTDGRGTLIGTRAEVLSIRNCELIGNVEFSCQWHSVTGGRCTIENCVNALGSIAFHHHEPDLKDVSIRVRGNSLVGNCLNLTLWTKPSLPAAGDAPPPVHLESSGNVAVWSETTRGFLYLHQFQLKNPLAAAQAEALLPRLVRLDEKQNVYQTGRPLLRLADDWQPLKGKRGQDLADWDRLWTQKNTSSVEGDVRFLGGDLVTRARSAPELLTGGDFRLRSDSAGYRAGKDGKDLGADVDLVGPGAAYERWKKTPEYQQWLKDSGQNKK